MPPNLDAGPLPGLCTARRLSLGREGQGDDPAMAVVVDFQLEGFTSELFAVHRIDCPAVIAASVRKRQAEFFYGRWAAGLALASLGAPPADIPIGPGREPVWPAGIAGSISHADGVAVAAACRSGPAGGIGIDVERIPTARVLAEIESLVSISTERTCLQALAKAHPAAPPGLFPTLLFSVKESLFKALYASLGRGFGFKDVLLTGIDPQRRLIHLAWQRGLGADRPAGAATVAGYELLADSRVLTHWRWAPGA